METNDVVVGEARLAAVFGGCLQRVTRALPALGLLLLGVGIGMWLDEAPNPSFSARRTLDVETVLRLIDGVGVSCVQPIDRRAIEDGAMAICRSEPRFDLHVSDSVVAGYESFDFASQVGCFTVGNVLHRQWYLAHGANWNLLTYSRSTAEALAGLRGVTITVGLCELPSSGPPV